MGRFDGKVVLITGGARGQGRSHALKFASEGADVAFCDIAAQIDTVPYPMAPLGRPGGDGQARRGPGPPLRRRRRRRARPRPGAGVRRPGEDGAGPRRLPARQRRDLLLRHRRRAGFDDLAGHDRHQPHRRLPRDARGAAHHDRAAVRPDRGHVVDGGQAGLRQRGPLRRGQVGRDRAGQVGGDRGGAARGHGQRDLSDQRGHGHDPELGGVQALPTGPREPDAGGRDARASSR